MTNALTGQMTWKPNGVSADVLHIRLHPGEEWRAYQEFPNYVLPDPPGFSPGYATFLALLKENWVLL